MIPATREQNSIIDGLAARHDSVTAGPLLGVVFGRPRGVEEKQADYSVGLWQVRTSGARILTSTVTVYPDGSTR